MYKDVKEIFRLEQDLSSSYKEKEELEEILKDENLARETTEEYREEVGRLRNDLAETLFKLNDLKPYVIQKDSCEYLRVGNLSDFSNFIKTEEEQHRYKVFHVCQLENFDMTNVLSCRY